MVKANRGVSAGTWYCEFQIAQSSADSHVRLGWANDAAETSGPVGFDQHSYAYRDIGGTRVHQSIRSYYGKPYGAGDTIGCMISFDTDAEELAEAEKVDNGASAGPADGVRQARAKALAQAGATRDEIEATLMSPEPPQRPAWAQQQEEAKESAASSSSAAATGEEGQAEAGGEQEGAAAAVEEQGSGGAASAAPGVFSAVAEGGAGAAAASSGGSASSGSTAPAPPKNTKHTVHHRFWGSSIRFFVNGEDQGIAFIHLTAEKGKERYYPAAAMYCGASVRLNPGPTFAFPPSTDKFPAGSYRPVSELEDPAVAQSAASAPYGIPSLSSLTMPGAGGVSAATLLQFARGQGSSAAVATPYNFAGTVSAYADAEVVQQARREQARRERALLKGKAGKEEPAPAPVSKRGVGRARRPSAKAAEMEGVESVAEGSGGGSGSGGAAAEGGGEGSSGGAGAGAGAGASEQQAAVEV